MRLGGEGTSVAGAFGGVTAVIVHCHCLDPGIGAATFEQAATFAFALVPVEVSNLLMPCSLRSTEGGNGGGAGFAFGRASGTGIGAFHPGPFGSVLGGLFARSSAVHVGLS